MKNKKSSMKRLASLGLYAAIGAVLLVPTQFFAQASTSGSGESAQAAGALEAAAAKAMYWNGLWTGQIDTVVSARERMIRATVAQPNDPELLSLIGVAYLTSVAQICCSTPAMDPSQIPEFVQLSQGYLQAAFDNPSTDEIGNLRRQGFLGGVTWALSAITDDPDTAQLGREHLAVAAHEIPDFGNLSIADPLRMAPLGNPDYAAAVEAFFRYFEYCSGTTLDRVQPDLTIALSMRSSPERPSCGNSFLSPHTAQGALFNFADALVKNQQPEAARGIYELIPKTKGYATWSPSYPLAVEERLTSDLVARAALYVDDDPESPRVGVDCFGCHQR
ncbi:MAG: hypothetical protein ACREO8_02665 [Luteimonas sp.]